MYVWSASKGIKTITHNKVSILDETFKFRPLLEDYSSKSTAVVVTSFICLLNSVDSIPLNISLQKSSNELFGPNIQRRFSPFRDYFAP